MKKLHLVSLGCTKNLVDSEVMLGQLGELSLTQVPEEADVIIVNTCGFIESAKQESINTILSLHELRKSDSLLVMAGCLSERYREELSDSLPEVDIFTGVGDYERIAQLLQERKSYFSDSVYLGHGAKRVITGSKTHAYIKLSEGCNQTCSFCAIPLFKGKLQSRTIENIIHEIKQLKSQGYIDFSLVSQDTSSYLRDQGEHEGLIQLIHELNTIEGIHVKILYLYPSTTTDALIETIIQSPVVQNYFDMPIQHIDDKMLKIMKRGSLRKRIEEILTHCLQAPEPIIRTGIIVGHPGEGESEFGELLRFIETFPFDRVSLFAYSDEEGTHAFSMEEKNTKKEINSRISRLSRVIKKVHKKSREKYINKELICTLEGESDEHEFLLEAKPLVWAPEIDGRLLINDTEIVQPCAGELYVVKVTESQGEDLLGTIIAKAGV